MFALKQQWRIERAIMRLVVLPSLSLIMAHGADIFAGQVHPLAQEGVTGREAEMHDAATKDKIRELALRSVADGDNFQVTWAKQSLRDAINKYREAYLYWQSIDSQRDAAEALEAAGELHFILSEYNEVLNSYEKAQAIRQRLRD